MKKDGLYTTGQFSKIAGITKKTLRYYDEKNILKPSQVMENGTRFYSDQDFARLQQILLLKFLGFSLSDIREMMVLDFENETLDRFLQIQKKLVEDKIEQLRLVEKTIQDTTKELEQNQQIDWAKMLGVIQITGMENSMRNQYKNASNISARINLHSLYAVNKEGWFPWIYRNLNLTENCRVLEVGCGDGSLWKEQVLPNGVSVVLTDASDGMIRDAKRNVCAGKSQFSTKRCDCEHLPFEDEEFDVVIANHVLFYCEDIKKACKELCRVCKKGGLVVAGTYGTKHMKEISLLVTEYDERIALSEDALYNRFGKQNGQGILEPYFDQVEWKEYEDELIVTEAEPLISYVLSCHGNQNQYIVDNYQDFKTFVKERTNKGFHITKEAGIFIARK